MLMEMMPKTVITFGSLLSYNSKQHGKSESAEVVNMTQEKRTL